MNTNMIARHANEIVRVGDWTVSFLTCTICKTDADVDSADDVKITPRSMEVLKYLCERPGVVVSLSELISEVWGRSTSTDHLVHKAIAELRNAMGDNPAEPVYIKTVPKRGYMIIAEVHGLGKDELSDNTGLASRQLDTRSRATKENRASFIFSIKGLGLLGSLILMIVISVSVLDSGRHEVSYADAAGVRLVVMPFANHGDSGTSQEILESVRFAIFSGLSTLSELEIIPAENQSMMNHAAMQSDDSADGSLRPTHYLRGGIVQSVQSTRIYIQLLDATSGVQQYAGQFDADAANMFAVQDDIASSVVSVFRHQMAGSYTNDLSYAGTTNVVAYERYIQGLVYYNQFNPDDFRRAISHFEEAVRLDPDFIKAYEGIAIAANNLAARGRSSTIEEMYALVDEVHRELIGRKANQQALNSVNAIKQRMRGFDYIEHEQFLRELILSGQPESFAAAHYALMLISARMYDEGARFLDYAAQSESNELTPDEAWSYRSNVMAPHELIDMRKSQLLNHPYNISILSNISIKLAFVQEFEQAEVYLSKLRSLDTEGILYHRARLMADYFSGKFEVDNDAVTDTLINDPDYFYNNGLLCFMAGNLDQGIAYWNAIPPVQRRQVFNDLHRSEKFFPLHVVSSPRYQQLLESLGLGARLQRQLMAGVIEMEALTGVDINTDSYTAYQGDTLMIRNNLWSESQWEEFENYLSNRRDTTALSNRVHIE
jgi:DNA-binding winged helix-turn-helix (wHTH) protein/TolB-like protein